MYITFQVLNPDEFIQEQVFVDRKKVKKINTGFLK